MGGLVWVGGFICQGGQDQATSSTADAEPAELSEEMRLGQPYHEALDYLDDQFQMILQQVLSDRYPGNSYSQEIFTDLSVPITPANKFTSIKLTFIQNGIFK